MKTPVYKIAVAGQGAGIILVSAPPGAPIPMACQPFIGGNSHAN